jgi:hypothetical protein
MRVVVRGGMHIKANKHMMSLSLPVKLKLENILSLES